MKEEKIERVILADYKEQVISEYQGNKLIEALPDILSEEEVCEKLILSPSYSTEERFWSKEKRNQLIPRLERFFQPLEQHIILESQFSKLIRQGYIERDPLSTSYVKQLHNAYHRLQNQSLDAYPYRDIETSA